MADPPKLDQTILPLAEQVFNGYRKQKRKEHARVFTVQLVSLVVLLGLWEIAGRLSWIDVLLFSYPSKVGNLLVEKLMDGSLLPHVGITVLETIVGFILGTLCGTLLATLLWWWPFLSKVLDPYIVVLNSMPKIALGPLLIVGLGPGMSSIIAMTLAVTVIITTLVVYSSFKEVDPNYVKVVRLYGGNRASIFTAVVFPASLPTIISTLKVNVGLSWIGVIVGEFLVSKQGLGYLIIYGFQVFNFTLVIGSLAIIAVVATLMYQAVSFLEVALMRRR